MIKFIKRLILRLFKRQGCYYINGPDTLPPPLTKEEEEKILSEIQQGNEDKKELLVIHNLRLVVYIAKNLTARQLQPRIWFLSEQ